MPILREFVTGVANAWGVNVRSAPARPARVSGRPSRFLAKLLLLATLLGALTLVYLAVNSILKPNSEQLLRHHVENTLVVTPGATPRRWKHIVVHHSDTLEGSAAAFDRYHREVRGWDSLGYHFVIGNGQGQPDGFIVAGPRWLGQLRGAHAGSNEYNERGIGICLVGNFTTGQPTEKQMAALRMLIRELCQRYNIPRESIYGHRDVRENGPTECPGKQFSIEQLRRSI